MSKSVDRIILKIKNLLLLVTLLTGFGLVLPSSQASEWFQGNGPQVLKFKYRDPDHRTFNLKMVSVMNQSHQLEVVVYLIENRLLFHAEHRILHGRDLDGDGYPETWFYEEHGMVSHVFQEDAALVADHGSGAFDQEKAIKKTLSKIFQMKHDNIFLEMLNVTSKFLLTSAAQVETVKDEVLFSDINFISLELMSLSMLKTLKPGEPVSKEILYHFALADRGLELNRKRLQEALGADYWTGGVVDAVLYFSLAKAGEAAAKGIALIAERLPEIPLVSRISLSFEEFTERYEAKVKIWTSKFGLSKAPLSEFFKIGAIQEVYELSYQALVERARAATESISVRSQFAGRVIQSLGSVLNVYKKGAIDEFKYLALSQGLQVVAESITRKQSPLQLLSNRDFMEDFLFMTNETIVQSGISVGTGSLLKKSGVIAVVSTLDSGAMNLAVKGVDDPKRVALDTGWEAIIGNAQTNLIDLNIIQALRRRGELTHNQRLVWVGYVLASIDQFIGYVGYAKATEALVAHEAAHPQNPKAGASQKNDSPSRLKLIPIFAPSGTII